MEYKPFSLTFAIKHIAIRQVAALREDLDFFEKSDLKAYQIYGVASTDWNGLSLKNGEPIESNVEFYFFQSEHTDQSHLSITSLAFPSFTVFLRKQDYEFIKNNIQNGFLPSWIKLNLRARNLQYSGRKTIYVPSDYYYKAPAEDDWQIAFMEIEYAAV
jgi:hypothetical protein